MTDWEKKARDRMVAFGQIEMKNFAGIVGTMMREAADERASEIAERFRYEATSGNWSPEVSRALSWAAATLIPPKPTSREQALEKALREIIESSDRMARNAPHGVMWLHDSPREIARRYLERDGGEVR